MQTQVKVVLGDESLVDLERAFLDGEVSGFPVIDKDGLLIGVVSRSDVVRQLNVEQEMAEYVADYFRAGQTGAVDPDETLMDVAERVGRRIEQLRVKDIMIRKLIVVATDASLTELAQMFVRHHIHRLPVVAGKRLVGIVTSLDLVRLLAERQVEFAGPGPD